MVKLLRITPEYAKVIEYASRVSTKTDCDETPEEFVSKLVKLGHTSIGRHAEASFEIICSRSCSHQLVRSVFLGITQESQRYVTFDEGFYIPESIKSNPEAKLFYKNTCEQIKQAYDTLNEMNIPREDSRYLLPNACFTRLIASANFNAWLDFITLRNQKKAQKEIREIAKEITTILIDKAPAFFSFFVKEDGYCIKKWNKK